MSISPHNLVRSVQYKLHTELIDIQETGPRETTIEFNWAALIIRVHKQTIIVYLLVENY